MAQIPFHRGWRVWAAVGLVLAQIQLVYVAQSHRHETFAPYFASAAWAGDGAGNSAPDVRIFCVACHILQQGAARPAMAASPHYLAVAGYVSPNDWPLDLRACPLQVLSARAPPLA